MPKKPAKPNAFLFFMSDWKENEERKGRSFPNGLKDVQIDPDCNAAWKNLNDQEKAVYKSRENNAKAKPSMSKKTGLGENVSDIDRDKMKIKAFEDNMDDYILNETYEAKNRNSVQKLKFCVIHVNFFYGRHHDTSNEMEYYPAEIAIVEFSLEEGITREYHEFVNEKIQMGFTGSAKDHSVNTHHIPPNGEFGKSNYKEIFRCICAFLEPNRKNGRLPPLYTTFFKEDVYQPTKSVLNRLARADQKADDYLLLYSFEMLFAYLYNATIEQMGITKLESVGATMELKKDPFAYKSGLACDFHEDLKAGVLYCSLSFVKRWIFVLCSFCCPPLKITMIPGAHKPEESTNLLTELSVLNSSISTLSLNESKQSHSGLSMTGVSLEHQHRVSERTQKEEQRRRAEANAKSIEIIDHSALNPQFRKPQEPIERPLRPPITKSAVTHFDTTDTESIDFSENSFPSIGRGSALKKKSQENKSSVTLPV